MWGRFCLLLSSGLPFLRSPDLNRSWYHLPYRWKAEPKESGRANPKGPTERGQGQPKGFRALFIDFIQFEFRRRANGGKLIEVPKAIRRRRGVGRGAKPPGSRRFLLDCRRTQTMRECCLPSVLPITRFPVIHPPMKRVAKQAG